MTFPIKAAFIIAATAGLTVLAVFVPAVIKGRAIAKQVETLKNQVGRPPAKRVDFSRFGSLPEPVQRYLRMALKDGQEYIHIACFQQEGKLMTNPDAETWSHFTAEQHVHARKPGFLWNAKISMAPLFHVRVVDSYIKGRASGSVLLLSAYTVASEQDEERLNSGALFRYLAEAVWYPTALLPGNEVAWSPLGRDRARATLTDSGVTVSLEFTFNERGEIARIYTTERYGLFNGEYKKYPWEGRFSNYIEKNGMKIPRSGEVGWHLTGGFWLFWKGELARIEYRLTHHKVSE